MTDTAYGPWRRVTGYTCATDPVHAAAINAWQSMTITPPGYTWWPGDGWTTTSWGLFPTVDDTPQTVTVNLAGTDVMLRATPTRWVWTQTDGTTHPMTRADSSQADTPPVAFARGPERRTQLALTTTWEGHYSLNNATTWIQAPGTATTTNPPQSLHIYNPKPRLVDCDLNGHCNSGQTAPTGPVPTITDPDADGTDNHTIPDNHIEDYLEKTGVGQSR
ncbi:hypothetical protein ON058_04705 [Demequina sp. B12]|uniref:hypothetical protein n=1 Tax=Demequina sp. B12 TaxID=2992757 RepID=UPI00237AE6DB|nr:hypothetical protein [Demequina sp. B12]MDE0572714.1 hypothetical protein [Demequina sp. B12]